MRGHGVRSAMFVPLVVERGVIGAMFMGHPRPRTFGEAEKQLARMLGSQAAVALANLRLYEQKDAALAAQKELTRRHETLYQIATEIFRSEDLEVSLQRLSDAAPAVLGVDLCLVTLRIGPDETRIVAVTNNFANCKGERSQVSTSNMGRAWAARQPLIIEDAPSDASIHPAYLHRLHIGSIIHLPLLGTSQEPIGGMTLIRHQVGAFRPEQVELATVLAARAAVAIETARLHEEARRAAQTHQMLLRELNHRVKNNLASIVALLGMDRPALPAEAAAWVNRVSERIATMARTHELFVGGNDRVPLHELVNKLLPALSLIRPAGVEIRADLDGLQVELGTERAVSLAMVLNELCWNALEHGMGENGVLQIRGYGVEGQRLVIEVEDDGGGRCSVTERPNGSTAPLDDTAANGRGTGLRLVEGLVSRELRGRFVMERCAAGGTRARIEIPLADGEAGGIS
jgi:two-component sensor histidine kinase